MDWKSIKYFVHVADVGSITVAAADLGIVQPALSRHIRRLEQEARVELFQRLPRGVQLTEAGRMFLERCRRIMREMALAQEELTLSREVPGGHVTFGIPGTLTQTLVPRLVERIRRHFPKVVLRVVEGTTPVLHEALLAGRLQAAILNNPTPGGGLAIMPLISESMVVFSPPQPAPARRFYTLNEITRTPVIVSAGIRAMVDDQIRPRGKRLDVEYEIDSVEAIRRILLRGMGITVLPVSTLRDDVEEGRIAAFPIADINIHRVLAIVHLANDLPPSVQAVIRVAQSEMLDLAARGVFATIPAARMEPARQRRLRRRKSQRIDGNS